MTILWSMEGSGRRLAALPADHAGPHEGSGVTAAGRMAAER
jgi:hypothetical protein